MYDSADWDFQKQIVTGTSVAPAHRAITARACTMMPVKGIVVQGIHRRIRHSVYSAATTAVAPVRSTQGNELLSTKMQRSRAARAGAYEDLYLVTKH
jgi:hypothetical protein